MNAALQQLAGAFDPRVGRLRAGAEVPVDDASRARAARPHDQRAERRARAGRHHVARRDGVGRACTTTSAAVSPATRSTASGSCPHFEKMLYDQALLSASTARRPSVFGQRSLPAGRRGDDRVRAPRPPPSRRRLLLGRGRRLARRATATDTRGCSTRGHRPRSRDAARRWPARRRRASRVVRHHPRRQLRGPLDPQPAPPSRRAATAGTRSSKPGGCCSRPSEQRPRPGLDDKVLTEWNGCSSGRWPTPRRVPARRLERRRLANGEFLLARAARRRTGAGTAPGRPTAHRAPATPPSPPITRRSCWPSTASASPPAKRGGSARRGRLPTRCSTGSGIRPRRSVHHRRGRRGADRRRQKDLFDNATPSANSTAAGGLLRLAALTGEQRYRNHADRILQLLGP